MEQTLLTEEQARTLELFRKDASLSRIFYLTGGTALAEFYLHHRYSDDLDFFTEEKEFPQFAVEEFMKRLNESFGAAGVEYRRLYDRRIFFLAVGGRELKVEFTSYPFGRLNSLPPHDGLILDSLEDIGANKVMALFDRIEEKDFVDLYFMMTASGVTLDDLRGRVKEKFNFKFDAITLGSEFAKVRYLTTLPRMLKPLTLEELKKFFMEQAQDLAPEIFK